MYSTSWQAFDSMHPNLQHVWPTASHSHWRQVTSTHRKSSQVMRSILAQAHALKHVNRLSHWVPVTSLAPKSIPTGAFHTGTDLHPGMPTVWHTDRQKVTTLPHNWKSPQLVCPYWHRLTPKHSKYVAERITGSHATQPDLIPTNAFHTCTSSQTQAR